MATGKRVKRTAGGFVSLFTQSVQLLIALAVSSLPGMMITYFLFASPVFGITYLSYRKKQARRIGINPPLVSIGLMVRAVVIGIFFTAAFIAPVRGCAYIMVRLTGVAKMEKILLATSFNGVLDAWLGVCGVCMAVIAGLMYWRQALRLKSQIVNIPTAKVRSAALGVAEFKGIARAIPDPGQRLTVQTVDGEELPFTRQGDAGAADDPIIYYRYMPQKKSRGLETILSRFYLEDDTGTILVDPRTAAYWDGKGHFLTHPTRHFFIQEDEQNRFMRIPGTDAFERTGAGELHQLLPGDEVYLIGSVEENSDADPAATGPDRLIVRPSSMLNDVNPINRIMLGESKSAGHGIQSIFFLADVPEQEARSLLTRGMATVWLWVAGWVALSLQPLIGNLEKLADVTSLVSGLRALVP